MSSRPEFSVTVRLLSTADGGRKTPLRSRYRSLIRFDNADADVGFQLTVDGGELAPGSVGTGQVTFWAADFVESLSLSEGATFEIREGTRTVGRGTILGTASSRG
jgi:elongation factor Tu